MGLGIRRPGSTWLFALVALLPVLLLGASPLAVAGPAQTVCTAPAEGAALPTATPNQEALDAAQLASAVQQFSLRARLSIRVFRNGCQVAGDQLNPASDGGHNNLFSVTKSVVSLLTGIAVGDGRLSLDDRIGRYLPVGPGWGDAAHRAITVRQLLQQSSGLDQSILAEAATTGLDPNQAREALAQPFVYQPGTKFQYSQLGPSLLAFVVQRAVGEDLQTFAQQRLFGPIGIPAGSYTWLRDQAGLTYGYSNLLLTPPQLARLGLLVSSNGAWRGTQVVPAAYVQSVSAPSATNGCYGLLFWTNRGTTCTGADIPAAQTVNHRLIPPVPQDAFEMNGTGGQLVVSIPSLHMTVVTTGFFGSVALDPSVALGAVSDELHYTFFRNLMKAVLDVRVPDPGPYQGEPIDLDLNPNHFLDPSVIARDLAPTSNCNVLGCAGTTPGQGAVSNLTSLGGLL